MRDASMTSARDCATALAYDLRVQTTDALVLAGDLNASQMAQNASDDDSGDSGRVRSEAEVIVVAVILGIIIVTTILGNLLVCITIITNKRMQSPTNLFILSLATTDLFLGIVVLPLSAMLTLRPHWPLGGIFCNIFISFDVTLCTVSILALFAISLDRYFAVSLPLRYQQKMSSSVTRRVNAGIWIFSFVMGFVPIHLGWNTPDLQVQNMNATGSCAFGVNKPYVLLVAVGTYFSPLIVMCGVYLKILRITKSQVKKINELTKVGWKSDTNLTNGTHTYGHAKHKDSASDKKATVTLASIVVAFAVCWVPYFALFVAKPFVAEPFNVDLDLFVLWLGYFNSAINPFLYAFYNSQFRDAFIRILFRHFPEKRQRLLHFFRERKRKKQSITSGSRASEMSALRKANRV